MVKSKPILASRASTANDITGHLHDGVILLLRPESSSLSIHIKISSTQQGLNNKSLNLHRKAKPYRILVVVVESHRCRCKWPITAWSPKLKCDRFWFIHILLYRFNPIRSQLETVLDFWLVSVCMKECELIKGGHTFGLLAVTNNH